MSRTLRPAPTTRGSYPPLFWTLADRERLTAAIRAYDDGEVHWTLESEGRVLGEMRDGTEFDTDPGRPRNDFSCSCGAGSRRGGSNPCTHVIAGLLDWWNQKEAAAHDRRTAPVLRSGPGQDASTEVPPADEADLTSEPTLLTDNEVDPAAGAIATFALLGPGLTQVRLSASPDDPLAITLELFDPAGNSTAKITPARSLALPILSALPRLLGESVRWTGATPPARVSPDPAQRILRARLDEKGRVVVDRAIRLPRRARHKKVLLAESEAGTIVTEGAVFHDGVLYPLAAGHLPLFGEDAALVGREGESAPRVVAAEQLGRFLGEIAPRLDKAGLLDGDSDILKATVEEGPRLERMTIDLASDEFLLRPTFSAGELEIALEEIRAAARGDGWIRRGNRWIHVGNDPLDELGLGDAPIDASGFLRLSRWRYLKTRALLPEGASVARSGPAEDRWRTGCRSNCLLYGKC